MRNVRGGERWLATGNDKTGLGGDRANQVSASQLKMKFYTTDETDMGDDRRVGTAKRPVTVARYLRHSAHRALQGA